MICIVYFLTQLFRRRSSGIFLKASFPHPHECPSTASASMCAIIIY